MATKRNSGQKFIARNRAPRVQIEYDVETYGSEKKIQIPFVMGVLADLSGKPAEALPDVKDYCVGAFGSTCGQPVPELKGGSRLTCGAGCRQPFPVPFRVLHAIAPL